MNKLGMDVSHWQAVIDWKKAKSAGIDFAFIKATQGADIVDARFIENWSNSQIEGVPRGAYHFYDPRIDPIAQAKHFLRVVPRSGEMPHVLDAEALKTTVPTRIPANYADNLRIFLEITEQTTGVRPIIYTAWSFWTTNCLNATWARQYPLWIANYNYAAPMCPIPWGGDGWTFWQFTDRGPGLTYGVQSKQIDLDVWRC
jgi:lysozyme